MLNGRVRDFLDEMNNGGPRRRRRNDDVRRSDAAFRAAFSSRKVRLDAIMNTVTTIGSAIQTFTNALGTLKVQEVCSRHLFAEKSI